MVQVFLHNSTLTPAPAAYQAAVVEVLVAAETTMGTDGEVIREGRVVLFLDLDPQDDIAVIELGEATDEVCDLVFDLAQATASFVLATGAVCAVPATGKVLPGWALGAWETPEPSDRAGFRDWLISVVEDADAETAREDQVATAVEHARAERDAAPQTPFFKRLTDALFGKSI
ncbi:hypothetical protein [Caulobacter soli]|uniref:hypothetical protein n=1 Tax=Caulobacter soli TaxID=2708539 RepID=UPI0013EBA635|nr:hypothetical protein [Caulobacter soli]